MTSPLQPDPEQQRVLAQGAGALLVTGGPGTGKTAVLRERLARLLEAGVDPERVALVVGSRRARAEAREVLLARSVGSLPELRVVTIHGLARQVVNATFRRLDHREPPEQLSAADQFALVQELLVEQSPDVWPAYGHMLGVRGFADEVRQFLSRTQEALLTPDEIEVRAEKAGLTGWIELARFYREYLDVIDARNVVDFAALLQRAAQVASDGEPLFDHLLVDDYQDTTFAAEAILEGLGAPDLIVAGEPGAHVFSFQGTTDVPILRFIERFAHAKHVELDTPHRAEVPITVEAWSAPHTSEEHAAVARELRRLHVEEGVAWNELAVVVRRQGSHLAGLLRALDDAGVPRVVPERGLSLSAEPATFPYVLALRWAVADRERREGLIEQLLTSDLIGLSPATVRGLTRTAQATEGSIAAALEISEGLSPEEASAIEAARTSLGAAEEVASDSVIEAFRVLWETLPCSARLVEASAISVDARRELDAVLTFAEVVLEAGGSPDPSTQAFLVALDAGDHGPGFSAWERSQPDAVPVVTAHGAVGQEWDSVIVSEAIEGNFPSLGRPEPMFDLSALERAFSRSERNRMRLEDERRLFRTVLGRARHRVVLTSAGAYGDDVLSARSRFADELRVSWALAPTGPFDEPVSVREATATWRRTLSDPATSMLRRLAALEGLAALGVDPARWWYQRDWTETGGPLHDELRLSYSKLSTLDNCELQHVLADELGLGREAGYQAWVGKTVHRLIEDCENGEVPKELGAILDAVDARWSQREFPSRAVSEAYRREVRERMMPNWFHAFADGTSLAVEQRFSFPFDGAEIVGVIDRIGPLERGGTRITDFKTGKPENAGKPEESLQLGIYFLAVQQCEELAPFRPVRAVELAFVKGHWRTPTEYHAAVWQVGPDREEAYQSAVREALSDLVARERALLQSGVYEPNPSANCRFCDFKTLCPLYPEGASPLEPREVLS